MPERVRREILITAMTYPELSTKYRESACTGGVFMDTQEWCRIYPMPIRYLAERVHRWDVISATVWQDPSKDSRPESWRVDADSIKAVGKISTGRGHPPTWERRRQLLLSPERCFESIERLKECQKSVGTSLGLIVPREGGRVSIEPRLAADEKAWQDKLHLVIDQGDLLERHRLRALDYLPNRIKVDFRCRGSQCRGHDCVVLDWEICELARRESWDMAKEKLQTLLGSEYETQFMMGNFSKHLRSFGIVGIWYPKAQRQRRLL